MQLPEVIKNSLEYIENNLKTEISAEELARMANYSTFHYYRLFSMVMGTSVSGYITKRRLDKALGEISAGRKAIDVVLAYGFDTYAGFYKAFTKMYGCSPRKYLSIYHGHLTKMPGVAKNKMYTEKELRKILENWDIEKNLTIRDVFLADGAKVSGHVWEIGGQYFLKTGERDKLVKNIRIARALDREGLQSALPVKTRAGEEYLDGWDIFILSYGLKGRPLPQADRFGDRRAAYGEEYGSSIARLHKALKKIQSDVCPDEVNLYQRVTEWALPVTRQQNLQWSIGLDEEFFDEYIDNFGKLYEKLPRQHIHRDPNPSNILFDGETVSGFIDFDISEINIRLWDPCYCATGILSEGTEEAYDKWPEMLGGILRGYDRENKLTAAEKEAVYSVILSIQMIFVAYLEREELFEMARINRNMMKYIISNKDKINAMIP
jgi:Ser/Thr protein kinase RdoA (MazF antagonist)/AraC-like DNA-binding protein